MRENITFGGYLDKHRIVLKIYGTMYSSKCVTEFAKRALVAACGGENKNRVLDTTYIVALFFWIRMVLPWWPDCVALPS